MWFRVSGAPPNARSPWRIVRAIDRNVADALGGLYLPPAMRFFASAVPAGTVELAQAA